MKRCGQRLQNPGYCAQADESTDFYRHIYRYIDAYRKHESSVTGTVAF